MPKIKTVGESMEKVDYKSLWKGVVLSALVAAMINSSIYLLVDSFDWIPRDVRFPDESGNPITLIPIIAATVLGAIGAGMLFSLLGKIASRPLTLFKWIAIGALLFSFTNPFFIPGAPTSMIWSLNLMHLVAGAIIIPTLLKMGGKRR